MHVPIDIGLTGLRHLDPVLVTVANKYFDLLVPPIFGENGVLATEYRGRRKNSTPPRGASVTFWFLVNGLVIRIRLRVLDEFPRVRGEIFDLQVKRAGLSRAMCPLE